MEEKSKNIKSRKSKPIKDEEEKSKSIKSEVEQVKKEKKKRRDKLEYVEPKKSEPIIEEEISIIPIIEIEKHYGAKIRNDEKNIEIAENGKFKVVHLLNKDLIFTSRLKIIIVANEVSLDFKDVNVSRIYIDVKSQIKVLKIRRLDISRIKISNMTPMGILEITDCKFSFLKPSLKPVDYILHINGFEQCKLDSINIENASCRNVFNLGYIKNLSFSGITTKECMYKKLVRKYEVKNVTGYTETKKTERSEVERAKRSVKNDTERSEVERAKRSDKNDTETVKSQQKKVRNGKEEETERSEEERTKRSDKKSDKKTDTKNGSDKKLDKKTERSEGERAKRSDKKTNEGKLWEVDKTDIKKHTLKIHDMNISPNPPKRGKDAKLTIDGILKKPLFEGRVHLKVTFLGITVSNRSTRLQSVFRKSGYDSEVPKGPIHLELIHTIPGYSLPGKYKISITIYDEHESVVIEILYLPGNEYPGIVCINSK